MPVAVKLPGTDPDTNALTLPHMKRHIVVVGSEPGSMFTITLPLPPGQYDLHLTSDKYILVLKPDRINLVPNPSFVTSSGWASILATLTFANDVVLVAATTAGDVGIETAL